MQINSLRHRLFSRSSDGAQDTKVGMKITNETSEHFKSKVETCVICLESYTTSGDHKIVSIKCGHTFGRKCIYTCLSDKNKACPTCKAHALTKHIRPVFLDCSTFMLEDNSELVSIRDELNTTKKALRKVEMEHSFLLSQCNSYISENKKLATENERLKQLNVLVKHEMDVSNAKTANTALKFRINERLLISNEGGCRVMAYSELDNVLCVSSPSSNPLYPGFGVRVVSIKHGKLMKFHHLHKEMIRNINFSPSRSTDLMMSCSMDKMVKLFSLRAEKTVSSYSCSAQVSSCCWSNNSFSFFAGLFNGAVEEIDTRKMTEAVSTVWTQKGGPVHSLRYVDNGNQFCSSGLIVTNSQKVLHLGLHGDPERPLISTLVAASHYRGAIVHSSFNDRTCHLLSLFRPGDDSRTRLLLSQIGRSDSASSEASLDLAHGSQAGASMYATEAKSFYGGRKMLCMSRACFLDDGDSGMLAVCPDEEEATVSVYDCHSDSPPAVLHPKDVTRERPVTDVCQIGGGRPVTFAALNSHSVYLYSQY